MVTPYFTQHSPPALVATLPPIEQISYDDGSGGYQSPCSAAAAFTAALSAPGSTTATWQSVSISTAAIRSRLSTMPPSTARRAAAQPAARAARDHRHPVLRRPADRGLHLAGVLGADHRAGVPADGSRDQSWRYFSTVAGSVTTTPAGRLSIS